MTAGHNNQTTMGATQADRPRARTVAVSHDVLDHARAAWRGAERDCERALHTWYAADAQQRRTRYFAYRAALDREEAAARDLDRLTELSSRPA
jgi:hypothetical protein